MDDLQNNVYIKLNAYSENNVGKGRLCSIPVAILDVALSVFKSIRAIECVALVAINLVGVLLNKTVWKKLPKDDCTVKDALFNAEMAVEAVFNLPVKLMFAPIKLVFQILAIAYDPVNVQSSDWRNPTFKKP